MESIRKNSLVNQRIVCDHLSLHKSKLHNFQIDKKHFFFSCKGARIKYHHYLKQEKGAQDVPEKAEKRKIIHDEIVLVKKKKDELTECIASFVSGITKYSIEAEANRDFTILTNANSF